MCGIVGYVGTKPAQSILLSGLARLEYRGYDSAGVAIMDGDGVGVTRTAGRIAELASAVESESHTGSMGIGHTRWATHGAPCSERSPSP